MAEQAKPDTPTKAASNPESPTTARPLDFDDEPQETNQETPPQKPPRPLSPLQTAENTLKEAFPTIDGAVVRAVLIASGGNIEPAFNALLGMTDPDAQTEPTPPPRPPRPPRGNLTSTAQSQVEADELYARQLAEHYSGTSGQVSNRPRRGRDGDERDAYNQGHPRDHRAGPGDADVDRDYSFFDDDLPVIRENIKKGFLETQSKVNTWVLNLKKKLDGDEDEVDSRYSQPSSETRPQSSRPRRSVDVNRRSGDRERYDADPQVLSDDFSALELRDGEAFGSKPRSTRPLANPDLFKPTPSAPEKRQVSFQDDTEDIPTTGRETINRTGSSGSKQSKWQPLSNIDPSPVAEHDPFSVGDSDDEKEARAKETVPEDADRLHKATAEAMAGDIGKNESK